MTEKNWMTPPEPVPESMIAKTIHADIVILGGGIAGVAAARAAAESGVSVSVLEKQREDRYEFFGGEMGSINSRFLLDAGVEQMDPMDYVNEFQRLTTNRTNPELIRQFAFNSGETFDWFLEFLPQSFKDTLHIFAHPLPRHFTGEIGGVRNWNGSVIFRGKGTSWNDAMMLMVKRAKQLGANFYFATTAEQIIKEWDRATGVVAKDDEGNYIRFMAGKGVLIACGDFSRNKEMLADLMAELVDIKGDAFNKFAGFGRDGDGQRMGIWAGGRMEPGPRAIMGGIGAGGAGPFGGTAFLRMNRYGRRFTNEATWAAGYQGIRQPKGNIAVVWDSNWREELEYQAPDYGNVDTSHTENMARLEADMKAVIGTGADGGRVRDTYTTQSMPYTVYSADTPGELADYLGYAEQTKKNFLATVKRYNELADKGRDEDFGKDARLMHAIVKPPFFGFVSRNDRPSFCQVTLSGLVIDENQNVLDKNDDPIPGLYATGNSSGGRYALSYFTPIAGNSIGMAMTLGRLVGMHIAKLK
ncbi:MAG: FAD-dependent oxidoreductase [Deltaproteobacteria bacterium]|nr:FAD-dependent oxidoreductase [Deltaproteobacteria bacterium]